MHVDFSYNSVNMETRLHPRRERKFTPKKKELIRVTKNSKRPTARGTNAGSPQTPSPKKKKIKEELISPSPKKAKVQLQNKWDSLGDDSELPTNKEEVPGVKKKIIFSSEYVIDNPTDYPDAATPALVQLLPLKKELFDPQTENLDCDFLDGDAAQVYEMLPPEDFIIEFCEESAAEPEEVVPKISPKKKINRPLHYGSEEESDDDEAGAELAAAAAVPRAARLYLQDLVGENADATNVNPDDEQSSELSAFDTIPASSSGKEFGPHKWEFNWEDFPENPVPPKERREIFDSSNCGPTVKLNSVYEAFTAIWTPEIMEHIARETNKYAQEVAEGMLEGHSMSPRSRIQGWWDTSPDELYVFFALVLATGLVVKSRMEEYWSSARDLFWTPGFASAMTCDRFVLLCRCIHFQDNNRIDPESMTRPQAKLFKIQPILDHLNDRFSTLYNMKQNVALDESLTQWKGWLDINQFVQNKAATVGVKTYEVCESQSGYLWRFEVHAGHDSAPSEESPISGIIPTLVLRLLRGLEGRGHTIWMDNYYNSPALARELKCRGFDCVGTLRANRKFVPAELASLTKKCMAPGEVRGRTAGDVDVLVWRDRRVVPLLSTYHGGGGVAADAARAQPGGVAADAARAQPGGVAADAARAQPGGVAADAARAQPGGVAADAARAQPGAVHDYNLCMGGVDRKDQMLALYPIERKRTRVWYKKLFRRLLNVSVLNAYILYRHNHKSEHRKFRKELCMALLERHGQTRYNNGNKRPIHENRYTTHVPVIKKLRRKCVNCPMRVKAYCEACQVPLCLKTCFREYHRPPK